MIKAMNKVSVIFFVSLFFSGFIFGIDEKGTTLLKPPFKHTWGINRGDEAKLDMLLGNVTDFINPQDLACVKLVETDDKKTEDDDDELTVFGVNSGRGQIIYNKSMKALGLFGSQGSKDGQFSEPHGITAHPDGWVLVADTGNKRVVLLRIRKGDLKFVRNIGSGVLEQPMDVAITPDELVFVTDAILGEILIFDLEGKFIRSIAKGVLNDPCGIDIDHEKLPKSRYRHNKIFVVDSLGKRINVLDFEGNLLQRTNLAKLGFPNGVSRYIALDYDNNVFMPDTVLHKIHKLDMELNHIVSMGKKGQGDLEFESPRGIAIWRRYGQVFVSDRLSASYYWLGVDLKSFDIKYDSKERKVSVNFDMTQKAYVTVEITGPEKFKQKVLEFKRYQQGQNFFEWQLPETGLKSGEYTVKVKIEPTYSSYTFFQIDKEKKFRF